MGDERAGLGSCLWQLERRGLRAGRGLRAERGVRARPRRWARPHSRCQKDDVESVSAPLQAPTDQPRFPHNSLDR